MASAKSPSAWPDANAFATLPIRRFGDASKEVSKKPCPASARSTAVTCPDGVKTRSTVIQMASVLCLPQRFAHTAARDWSIRFPKAVCRPSRETLRTHGKLHRLSIAVSDLRFKPGTRLTDRPSGTYDSRVMCRFRDPDSQRALCIDLICGSGPCCSADAWPASRGGASLRAARCVAMPPRRLQSVPRAC